MQVADLREEVARLKAASYEAATMLEESRK
jgi:hypothetical protein